MKKFLIPLLLLFTSVIFAGCGTKEANIPENTNKSEPSIEEVQETIVEESNENSDNVQAQ